MSRLYYLLGFLIFFGFGFGVAIVCELFGFPILSGLIFILVFIYLFGNKIFKFFLRCLNEV